MISLTTSFAVAFACVAVAGASVAATPPAQPGVVKADHVTPKPGPPQYFTGSVTVAGLVKPAPPGRTDVGLVSFPAGARSNWHTHPAGQTLYVVDGCGWTQREGGPVERICKGDVVYVPPGVRHWHGATDRTAMRHVSITETVDGRNVDWAEPVSAPQFHGPER